MKSQLPSTASFAHRLHVDPPGPEPEAVSIDETCRLTGIGRSKLYELIADGTLPSLKIGKRRLVRLSTVRRLIAELERVGTGGA